MRTQRFGEATGDLLHRGVGALEPIDREREVQCLLDLPDSLMRARRQLARAVDSGLARATLGSALACLTPSDLGHEVLAIHVAQFAESARMDNLLPVHR
jgi:hypothetical protein